MAEKVFDRETLLDLTVNFIPLAILAVFFLLYVVYMPFGFDSVVSTVHLAIVGMSAVGLVVLTYYSGKAVSKAEKAAEREAEMDVAEESAEIASDSEE